MHEALKRPRETAAEIMIVVPDARATLDFYLALGFQMVDEDDSFWANDHLTDGVINIEMVESNESTPAIVYSVPDLPAAVKNLRTRGLEPLVETEEEATFVDPDGLHIYLTMFPMPPQPSGHSTSKAGRFGELALAVKNLATAQAFYKKLGFQKSDGGETPYPWAVMTDGHMVIGLHQTDDFSKPALAYFSADAAERIAGLKAAGLQFADEVADSDGRIIDAKLVAPDGQVFFVFAEPPKSSA